MLGRLKPSVTELGGLEGTMATESNLLRFPIVIELEIFFVETGDVDRLDVLAIVTGEDDFL